MNIVLNLKESQLGDVLEVLGKVGGTVDIVINIKEEEPEKKVSGLTPSTDESMEKEEEEKEEEEKEEEEKEEKEKEAKEEASEETIW
jgi:hypothetical protein